MKASELFGKEVLDVNANRVGKVADMDVDVLKGAVNHIIIKAGLTKKRPPICSNSWDIINSSRAKIYYGK